jgi:hypothetical protein
MAAEQGLDAGQGPAGRRGRQLLPGDLEQQRPYRSIGGSCTIHAWGSKAGYSSMSRASTGSASRRWQRGWKRVIRWIRRKHRKITWKQLRRRYCGGRLRLTDVVGPAHLTQTGDSVTSASRSVPQTGGLFRG